MTIHQNQLAKICRDHGVIALYAFGSRASEAAAALAAGSGLDTAVTSDLDLGVLTRRGAVTEPRALARLAADLEDAFGAPRVDLVLLSSASSFLALDVISGSLLVDLDPDETARFELYVMRRAGDLSRFEAERRRAVLTEGAM